MNKLVTRLTKTIKAYDIRLSTFAIPPFRDAENFGAGAKCKQKIRDAHFALFTAASVVGFGKNYKFPANLLPGADTPDYRGADFRRCGLEVYTPTTIIRGYEIQIQRQIKYKD